jgi:hypothetical protein
MNICQRMALAAGALLLGSPAAALTDFEKCISIRNDPVLICQDQACVRIGVREICDRFGRPGLSKSVAPAAFGAPAPARPGAEDPLDRLIRNLR